MLDPKIGEAGIGAVEGENPTSRTVRTVSALLRAVRPKQGMNGIHTGAPCMSKAVLNQNTRRIKILSTYEGSLAWEFRTQVR